MELAICLAAGKQILYNKGRTEGGREGYPGEASGGPDTARDAILAQEEKGEDITMDRMLDYVENRGIARGVEIGIQALIEAYGEAGISYDVTTKKVMEKFGLDRRKARQKMKKYWKAAAS